MPCTEARNSKSETRSIIARRLFSGVAAFFVFFALAHLSQSHAIAATSFAAEETVGAPFFKSLTLRQTNLERRAEEERNRRNGNTGTERPTEPTTPTPTPTRGRRNNGGRRPPQGSGGGGTPVASQIEVTFVTGMPFSDVYLNDQVIGKTDAEGKFVKRIARGTYKAVVGREGKFTVPQQIRVQPRNRLFTFVPPAGMNPTIPSTPTSPGAPTSTSLTPTPAKTEEVISRYLNPKESASVTPSDWQRVLTDSKTALEREPNNSELKVQNYFAEGQLAFLRKDYVNALGAFTNAASAKPDSALAHYGMGTAYLATRQSPQAIRAFQTALRHNKELALAHKGIGDALTLQNKSKEALAAYERAQKLGFESDGLDLSTAQNLIRRERWTDAIKILEELVKTKPSAEVYEYLGDSYRGAKQPLSATPAYRKAIEMNQSQPMPYFKLGEVLYEEREFAGAREAMERALALDSSGAIINRQRARKIADESAKRVNKLSDTDN